MASTTDINRITKRSVVDVIGTYVVRDKMNFNDACLDFSHSFAYLHNL